MKPERKWLCYFWRTFPKGRRYLHNSSFCVISVGGTVTAVRYSVSFDPLFSVISALSGNTCYLSNCLKIDLLGRSDLHVRQLFNASAVIC